MPISEYILNDIELQPITQTVGNLKKMFDELTASHIQVGKDGIYLGCVSENDIRCFDSDKTLEEYQYAISPFYTHPTLPLLDILKSFATNHTNIIPVLEDNTNDYLGYLELNDVISLLNEAPFFNEEGNIIIVEKEINNFSFSEIAQIVESNQSKIFGFYISYSTENIVQITIKTGFIHLNEILQTFRRYEYKIISEHQEDSFLQDLQERSAYLNKYLNI